MSVALLLRRAATMPAHLLLRKAGGLALRKARAKAQRQRDRRRSSYEPAAPDGTMHAYVTLTAEDIPDDLARALPSVAALVIDHRFDLLGSGWTAVHYGAECRGIEGVRYPPAPRLDADRNGEWLVGRINPANLPEARRLWRLIDRPDYRPIDWQLDFKSGYRWSEQDYFLDIAYGRAPGADIKVPWELARMQHLPWLALASVLARSGRSGYAPAKDYAREVRNQILDFLAVNPPRFGVNWRCPMDVAIRIANWLLALDILRGAGFELDGPFRDVVRRAAVEHGRHILAHLEWSETGRSNHYLSDIVGLLFAGAYLPRSAESDAWLAFAVQQLESEIAVQFAGDGGNYEGSTAYHGLSAELVVYASALLLGLPPEKRAALRSYDHRAISVRPPFRPGPAGLYDLPGADASPLPLPTFQRIAAMANFLRAATKPSGRFSQIGDTDSGRLFKLHPVWRRPDTRNPDEDHLDRRATTAALDALIAGRRAENDDWLDARMIGLMAKGRAVKAAPPECVPPPAAGLAAVIGTLERLPAESRRVTDIPLPADTVARDALACSAFPEFGLYILRAPRFFLSLRCASHARADAPSGHTHDDNLAIELHVDGRDLVSDPGSYLYTPIPEIRERYRSAGAHFVPRPAGRSAVVTVGLFGLRHVARAACLYCGTDGLAGRLDGPDWQAWRVVELLPGVVRITDACSSGPLAPIPSDPPAIATGYGKLAQSPAYSL